MSIDVRHSSISIIQRIRRHRTMRLRRFAALMSALALSLGMVGAVSAMQPPAGVPCNPENQVSEPCPESQEPSWEPSDEPSTEPTDEESDEPSSEPTDEESDEPSTEPTDEESDEPSTEPTDEESDEPSTEPTDEESDEPSTEPTDVNGEVEGLTSQPTLPPTDPTGVNGRGGPDATLPLVLLILGSVGLASFTLAPKRSRR
jgi:outer membrane biosynthesis protein TonB